MRMTNRMPHHRRGLRGEGMVGEENELDAIVNMPRRPSVDSCGDQRPDKVAAAGGACYKSSSDLSNRLSAIMCANELTSVHALSVQCRGCRNENCSGHCFVLACAMATRARSKFSYAARWGSCTAVRQAALAGPSDLRPWKMLGWRRQVWVSDVHVGEQH